LVRQGGDETCQKRAFLSIDTVKPALTNALGFCERLDISPVVGYTLSTLPKLVAANQDV
jgi:hypothetical protein